MNTHFIEQINRQGDQRQSHGIARRGDDGRYDGDAHDGMAAVAAHEMAVEDAHASKNGTDDGQLEDNSHDKTHGDERVGIGLQGKHIVHINTYLVGPKESDGERKDEQIVE